MKIQKPVGFMFAIAALIGCSNASAGDPADADGQGDSLTNGSGGAPNGPKTNGPASHVSTAGSGSTVPAGVGGTPPALGPCSMPRVPLLEAWPSGAKLSVASDPRARLALVPTTDKTPASNEVTLPTTDGPVSLQLSLVDADCASPTKPLELSSTVAAHYPPSAGLDGSTAVPLADPRIVGWATKVTSVSYGANVDANWKKPERALGVAEGTSFGVVSLGEGGVLTLEFGRAISDGAGPEFAVFENSFGDRFLELGYVELSSDGTHFVRFATASLGTTPVDAYGELEPTQLAGFAGKYRQGFGTPFDLAWLRFEPLVLAGLVDLQAIRYLRVVDVIGDGSQSDDFGHPIYDPTPTSGSAGFDLDAVAVLTSPA